MKKLLERKQKLVREFNYLLCEYREYQSYFKNTKSPHEAELKYYSECFNRSGHDVYYEGKYSLEHKSIFTRIKENKSERNKLISEIKKLKIEIKKKIK